MQCHHLLLYGNGTRRPRRLRYSRGGTTSARGNGFYLAHTTPGPAAALAQRETERCHEQSADRDLIDERRRD